jgi:hypothetical protein
MKRKRLTIAVVPEKKKVAFWIRQIALQKETESC